MANILPPANAETVNFSPPVVDNEITDLYRDREAIEGIIIADADIDGLNYGPLPDEGFASPSEAEAIERLDPIIAEQITQDSRLPDEIAIEGQKKLREEEFTETVGPGIFHAGQVNGAFTQNQQTFHEETGDYFQRVYDTSLTISPLLADVVQNTPNGPAHIYHLIDDPVMLDTVNRMTDPGSVRAALNRVGRDWGVEPRVGLTGAPPPLPVLRGRGATTPRSPSNMSYSQYAAGRRSGKIK